MSHAPVRRRAKPIVAPRRAQVAAPDWVLPAGAVLAIATALLPLEWRSMFNEELARFQERTAAGREVVALTAPFRPRARGEWHRNHMSRHIFRVF